MGPVGASIGQALRRARLNGTEVVGASGDRGMLASALKSGAIDKAVSNLRSATEDASMVILDVPLTEARGLLEAIGPILPDGCIVTDICPTKVPLLAWAEQYLPKGISFVGGHPLLRHQPGSIKEADPSLFAGANFCIIPSRTASQEAVKSVVKLVETLGSRPLFMDPHEHDSYVAAVQHLPAVMAAAYLTATTSSPAWKEIYRLAAAEFGDISRPASGDPRESEAACLANPDLLVHWLDEVMAELALYRKDIVEGSSRLMEKFAQVRDARARWDSGAAAEEGRPRVSSAGEHMAKAIFGEHLVKRYRQLTGRDRRGDGNGRPYKKS